MFIEFQFTSMPRKILIRSKTEPYHVTARCNNKEPFHCDLRRVWEIFSFEFSRLAESHLAKVHAFVLMPNHFHLLVSTPNGDIDVMMQALMQAVTRKINLESGRTGRVFGARYHGSLITTENYYDCALKYVYRNPVKAGLALLVEDYPYSSLRSLLGATETFPISHPSWTDENVPQNNRAEFTMWLNQPFPNEHNFAIKQGLRRTFFQPEKIGNNRKRMELAGFGK